MLIEKTILFLLCSIIGWVWEVLLNVICYGEYVNRGMLYGPWIPIYGVGALLILAIAFWTENPYQTFVISAATCGLLEYGTSFLMERKWKMRWWNYTGAFNVHGRINLLVLIVFGGIGVLFYYFVVPKIGVVHEHINYALCVMVAVICLILAVDFAYSQIHPNTAGITEFTAKSNHRQV